jgi:predicted nucleotidyltransferase
MEKKFGLKNKLTDFMVSLRGVKAAFIFGSFASSKETNLSDLDLMIVGNPNQDKLIDGIKKIEDMFGREINYHVYKEKEIEDGLKKHNKFLLEIFSSPIIILTGYINEFKSITRK